jgi:hypothetical protein
VVLGLCSTDDGVDAHDVPYVSVMVPGITDEAVIITRGERGWQMHRGGDGPLYEFASEREAAEFFIPRVGHRFGCLVAAPLL